MTIAQARKHHPDGEGWREVPSVYSGGSPIFFFRRHPETDRREWFIYDTTLKAWRFDYDD